jgi:hypothetical protein
LVDGIFGKLRLEDLGDGRAKRREIRRPCYRQEVEQELVKEVVHQLKRSRRDKNWLAGRLDTVLIVPGIGMAVMVVCNDL